SENLIGEALEDPKSTGLSGKPMAPELADQEEKLSPSQQLAALSTPLHNASQDHNENFIKVNNILTPIFLIQVAAASIVLTILFLSWHFILLHLICFILLCFGVLLGTNWKRYRVIMERLKHT